VNYKKEEINMKKSIIAVMMAAVTVGAVGGGIATFNASQTDTQLQIAGESEGTQTLPDAEDNDGAAKEEGQDAENETAASPEQEQTATEVAASLPSGSLERTRLANVEEGDTIADIAENVMPAMVSITNTSVPEVQDWFRGGSMQYESKSAGSGVIMGENDSELLIVSNNHVVEGATNIAVTFINETSVEGIVKGKHLIDFHFLIKP
jgi:S1-C subfamily serine protease